MVCAGQNGTIHGTWFGAISVTFFSLYTTHTLSSDHLIQMFKVFANGLFDGPEDSRNGSVAHAYLFKAKGGLKEFKDRHRAQGGECCVTTCP